MFCINNVAYPTTSHEKWRFIPHRGDLSHEPKLSGIYETEVWDKSHMPSLVVG